MKLNYISYIVHNLIKTFFSPHGWLYKTAFAIVMYFAGIHLYIVSVTALVLIDVITGVWASIRRGESFKSRILRQGLLEKLLLYIFLLIGAFFLGAVLHEVFGFQKYYVAGALTILIDVYEISSVIENIVSINPSLQFLNSFKDLLNKFKDKQLAGVEKKITTTDKKK